MSSLAWGDSFTNHAGHAVSGSLSAISNGTAVISGRKYPMSAFPDDEQRRMRELLDVPDALPPPLAALRRSLKERMLRVDALAAEGANGDAAAKARRAKLQSIWASALNADDSLSPATRRYWLPRLMDP